MSTQQVTLFFSVGLEEGPQKAASILSEDLEALINHINMSIESTRSYIDHAKTELKLDTEEAYGALQVTAALANSSAFQCISCIVLGAYLSNDKIESIYLEAEDGKLVHSFTLKLPREVIQLYS